jgi:D-arabinose 1-dehydrogenase-like Zn-dependent alcohol dehydrogenase
MSPEQTATSNHASRLHSPGKSPKQRARRKLITGQYNEPYALGNRPVPSIRESEILVRVHAAGFCHSDLQALEGQFERPAPIGLIPSHEVAGIVAKLGSKYDGNFQVGDRVGVLNFKHACGACVGCKLRKWTHDDLDPRFCEVRETAGFLHDGGFADYIAADPATTVLLPESIPFDQAAPLMCAGATIWGSLERTTAGLPKGSAVAVVGIGGLGHLGLQFAKAMGFKTIAIDNRKAGRSLAVEIENVALIPDLVVDSPDTDSASREIFDFTGGEGVTAAVVCTSSVGANRWALTLLRHQGCLGVLGLPQEPWQFDAAPIVFRELSIKGAYVCGAEAAEKMLQVVATAGVKSHLTNIHFEQIPDIVKIYTDDAFQGRIVVDLSR